MCDPIEAETALSVVKEEFGHLSHRLCLLLHETGPLTKEQILLALCAGHAPLAPPPPAPPGAIAKAAAAAGQSAGAIISTRNAQAASHTGGGQSDSQHVPGIIVATPTPGFTASAAAARAASLGSRSSADPTLPSLPQTPSEVQGCLVALLVHGIVQPRTEVPHVPQSIPSGRGRGRGRALPGAAVRAGAKRARPGTGASSSGSALPGGAVRSRLRYEFGSRQAIRRLSLPRLLERVCRELGPVAGCAARALTTYGCLPVGMLRQAVERLLPGTGLLNRHEGDGNGDDSFDDDAEPKGGRKGTRKHRDTQAIAAGGVTESNGFEAAWAGLRDRRFVRRARGLALAKELLAGTDGALPVQGLSGSVRDVGRGALSLLGVDAGGPGARDATLQLALRGVGGSGGTGAGGNGDGEAIMEDGLELGTSVLKHGSRKGLSKKGPKSGKRKQIDSDSESDDDGEGGTTTAMSELWCFDPRPIVYQDRDNALTEYVSRELSADAGLIVKAMLQVGPAPEAPSLSTPLQARADKAVGEVPGNGVPSEAEWSAEVTAREVFDRLTRLHKELISETESASSGAKAGKAMSWEVLQRMLDMMRSEPLEYVQRVGLGADGGSWRVRIARLLTSIHRLQADDLAKEGACAALQTLPAHQAAAISADPTVVRAAQRSVAVHGIGAVRVLQLLRARGQVQAKTVADGALLALRDARTHLYTLRRLGLVQNFPLPRRPDHAPGLTVYLWGASDHAERDLLTRRVLETMRNLQARRRSEEQRHRELEKGATAAGESALRARRELMGKVVAGIERLDAATARLSGQLESLTDW